MIMDIFEEIKKTSFKTKFSKANCRLCYFKKTKRTCPKIIFEMKNDVTKSVLSPSITTFLKPIVASSEGVKNDFGESKEAIIKSQLDSSVSQKLISVFFPKNSSAPATSQTRFKHE